MKTITVKEYCTLVRKSRQAVCKSVREAKKKGEINKNRLPNVVGIEKFGRDWMLQINKIGSNKKELSVS